MGAALLGNAYIEADGHWVSKEYMDLAEAIKMFDQYLELVWIPPENRSSGNERPFAVMHKHPGLEPYIIFYLTEQELIPNQVLFRLTSARMAAEGRTGTLADRVEAAEQADKVLKAQQTIDELEELRDKASFLWNSPLHDIKMDGKVFRT